MATPNDDSIPQVVVVMRHGEREDFEPNAVPLADPHLTSRGREEARSAAHRLRDAVGHSLCKRLRVVSSPFLRTIETAKELQSAGIGRERTALMLDNTLCEVFGPIRIKTPLPPDIQQKDATGQLPMWGETIQLAETRFVDSFMRNATQNAPDSLLLVTHGDAIASILRHFYPLRTAYNCDFLGFLVLRRSSRHQHDFVLTHHCGVQWVLDNEEPPSVAPSKEIRIDRIGAARGEVVSPNDRDVNDLTPLTRGASGSVAAAGVSYASETSSVTVSPYRGVEWEAQGNGAAEPNPYAYLVPWLRLALVASQALAMRVWPSVTNGAIYFVIVAVIEIVAVKYSWRNLAERLPFLLFGTRSGCPTIARLAPFRTALKATVILLVYTLVAGIAEGMRGRDSGPHSGFMQCYGSNFHDGYAMVVYLLFFAIDICRGWQAQGQRCDDPRRE